jgi:Na+/proline symporter
MSAWLIILIVAAYFALLIVVARLTSRGANNESFYVGNRSAKWYVVAFGMIGASLSGVTFLSIPGWVDVKQFSYMQTVFGYVAGYAVIGTILLPLYYRLNLTSIYTYLQKRFGQTSYKTGAWFFLISRTMGAAFRLFLVALVFNEFVFKQLGYEDIPFWVPVSITIALIWLYTSKGGIKTIIWTDTLQTFCMLVAVIVALVGISNALDFDFGGMVDHLVDSPMSQVFFWDDFNDSRHFVKQFIGGAFIAIAMTGLDQDMMQKNLACKNLKDAQKNMLWFSVVLVFVNVLFLALGALLYSYVSSTGMASPERPDLLFPSVALGDGFGIAMSIFFILGLIASAYSSADSALTSLTTSFCVDIMDSENKSEEEAIRLRKRVHIGMSFVLLIVVILFNETGNSSVIGKLFTIATFTYGPLLGLYAFGLMTKRKMRETWVPYVAILAPELSLLLMINSTDWFGGYEMSFELLPINGLLTFIGLWLLSIKVPKQADSLPEVST